jgi:hypothetical protein
MGHSVRKFVEQRLGFLQVGGVEALGEPQGGPFQSNGMCLLDLPVQLHWKSCALTWLAVLLPQVHT